MKTFESQWSADMISRNVYDLSWSESTFTVVCLTIGSFTFTEMYRVGSSDFPVVNTQLAESPTNVWRTFSAGGSTIKVSWNWDT